MTATPAPASAALPDKPAPSRVGPLLVAVAIGTAASVGLGVYGRLHTPTGQAINIAGFSNGLAAKAALTTAAFILAVAQIITGPAIIGRIPLKGAWLGPAHRWCGRLAVLCTVPVAVHCLYALGYQTFDARVAAHSLMGCLFFGAFIAKMLVLTRDDAPGWVLPVLGGLVFSVLTGLWLTAAVWFFVNGG
jgi:hypothetical protein